MEPFMGSAQTATVTEHERNYLGIELNEYISWLTGDFDKA